MPNWYSQNVSGRITGVTICCKRWRSIGRGSVGMAPFPPRLDAGGYRIQQSVKRRILTALLVAPPALLLVVLGPPWSDLLLLLLAGVMASEWARICSSGRAW